MVLVLSFYFYFLHNEWAGEEEGRQGKKREPIEGWSVQDLPSPVIDPVGCNSPGEQLEGSFVCNPDELLTPRGAQRYVCCWGMEI